MSLVNLHVTVICASDRKIALINVDVLTDYLSSELLLKIGVEDTFCVQ